MGVGGSGAVLRQVERLFGPGTVAGLGEGQLLERYLSERDEVAFEALVSRHGPMVLGVCRRLLGDPHDVEDAFQATFLVLVKKAGAIRDRDLLGPWLYGVAHRVAVRARGRAAVRRSREVTGPSPEPAARPVEAGADELRPVLDEEIGRLPEKYRVPILLCYFEGLSHDQAAANLRWPVGTVRSRLARGRDLLRGRLTRRGLAPVAGLIASGLTPRATSAAVPPALIEATIRAATRFAMGRMMTAGVVSASVATLTKGVVTSMFLSHLKVAAVGLVAAGIVASGAGVWVARGSVASDEPGSSSASPNPEKAPRTKAVPNPPNEKPETFVPSRPETASAPMVDLENRLHRAIERLAWAEKMAEKGYVTSAQLLEARDAVEVLKAQIADQARALESLREDLQEQQEQLRGQIERVRKEIQRSEAEIEVTSAVVANNQRLNQKRPGMVSADQQRKAEAEAKVKEAERDIKQAELKEVEIRLDQVARRLARLDQAKDRAKEPAPIPPAPPSSPAPPALPAPPASPAPATPAAPPAPPARPASPVADLLPPDMPPQSDRPRVEEPRSSDGGSPSIREIGARLRAAQALLDARQPLVKSGGISRSEFEKSRSDVDILKAQLESLKDALQDERELLEAQLEAKAADARRAEGHLAQVAKQLERTRDLASKNVVSRQEVDEFESKLEMTEAERDARRADRKEIEIRLKQVTRRLDLIEAMRLQAK
jgi:RNA polymerase sigma factor (sigma-70 family)